MTAAANRAASLTVQQLAEAKQLPPDYLRGLGLEDAAGAVAIPYYGVTGEDVAVKRRTAAAARDGCFWPKGQPLAAYGLWRLDEAARAGHMLLVEGESDCWTLWYHGFPALGVPGANSVRVLEAQYVEALGRAYVWREPDGGGDQFVPGVAARLRQVGFRGEILEVSIANLKDPSDLHVLDSEHFRDRLTAALAIAREVEPTSCRNGKAVPNHPPPARRAARAVEAYRPFPVEALPNPVREYVSQGAQALGCDPAYVALPALAVAASAIGNSRTIRLKRGWTEPSVVWSVIIGDSGTLKSPAYLKAVDHLLALQRRKVLAHREKMRTFRAARRRADQGEGKAGEEPALERVVCSDITIETVAGVLEDNPRGVLVARDELSGWLGSFTRYKGKSGGTDLPNWLEMHRAGTVVVDRKTGERRSIYASRAAVSVTGSIQPSVLARALGPESFDSGLAARLLMAMPPRRAKRWSEVEVDPEAEQAYRQLVDSLLALELRDVDDDKVPHALPLSPEAKAVWVAFYNDWAAQQAAVEGELAAAYSKLEGYAARLALLHHVVTHLDLRADDVRPIGPRSIEAGITLARWFATEARRIYATLSESTEERDGRRLVEFVQSKGGTITARELQRSNNRKYPTATLAEIALDALVQAGLGVWEEVGPSSKGGHPTRQLVLCTTHDTTDTTPPVAGA